MIAPADTELSYDNVRILADDLASTWTKTYNAANELTQTQMQNSAQGTTITFDCDAWGRTTEKAMGGNSAEYAWRYGSMLHEVTSTMPDEGNVSYEYGGDNKRRSREAGSDYTWYNWDMGWNTISETDNAGNLTRSYAHNPQRGGRATLAHVDGANPGTGAYTHYTHDHLGSTRGLYDGSKNLLHNIAYTPYGAAATTTNPGTTHRYTGHQWDSASGLYFAPYRFYNPTSSRWMKRDPLGMVDGPNVYEYVLSNPTFLVDALGLRARHCRGEVAAAQAACFPFVTAVLGSVLLTGGGAIFCAGVCIGSLGLACAACILAIIAGNVYAAPQVEILKRSCECALDNLRSCRRKPHHPRDSSICCAA